MNLEDLLDKFNKLDSLGMRTEPTFPVDWFAANKCKPKLEIGLSTSSSLTTTRAGAYDFVRGAKNDVEVVIEYLYHLFQTMKEDLTEPWISYGVNIGQGEITPASLVDLIVVPTERNNTPSDCPQLTNKWDPYLVILLMGLYRFGGTHESQKSKMMEQVRRLVAPYAAKVGVTVNNEDFSRSERLTHYQKFEFMAAALDMFLERFPNNRYAKARFGTSILRNKCCTVLKDLEDFTKMVGLENKKDFREWCILTHIIEELDKMLQKKDEFDVKHSYFPYAFAFPIGESPYSVSRNPCTYRLLHMVGCLFQSTRSINAHMFLNGKCVRTIWKMEVVNAAIIYFAKKESIFSAAPEIRHKFIVKYINAFKYTANQKLVEELKLVVDGIRNPRKGTIGEWMKTSFIQRIQQMI